MSKHANTSATTDDPATVAQERLYRRLKARITRMTLKKRRQKSGQPSSKR